MRFKQFINEESKSAEEIAAQIERDCKSYLDYIRAFTNGSTYWLKRGINKKPDAPYFKAPVNKNRTPTDTSSKIHRILDYNLKELYGEKFRSESIFCSTKIGTASSYGYPYFVFPVGEWKYCWSPIVADAYSFFDNHKHDTSPEGLDKIERALGQKYSDSSYDVDISSDRWLKMIRDYLHVERPYKTDGLKQLIESGKSQEVMVVCDEVYYVPYTNKSSKLFGLPDDDENVARAASDVMEILSGV